MRYLQFVLIFAGIKLVSSECGGLTLPGNKYLARSQRNNIVGGNLVTNRSAFSYQASLMLLPDLTYHCGATIISSKHLLTAAHCVVNNGTATPPGAFCVIAGHLNILHEELETEYRSIERIFVFPDYDDDSSANDIAVIEIYKKYDSSSISISALPMASMTPFDNTVCIVSGWGATSETESFSAVLQYVEVLIINKRQCNLSYDDLINDGMICAGYMEGGRDACQGDSGGPLVCNGKLVGLVSWGESCALEGFPGVYADVTTYKRWIEEQMKVVSAYKQRATRSASPNAIVPTFQNCFILLLSIFAITVTLKSE